MQCSLLVSQQYAPCAPVMICLPAPEVESKPSL
jgi:hypothetical protein